jgi:hypothetical protein
MSPNPGRVRGRLLRRIAHGIRVGYSNALHGPSGIAFNELADIHQRGLGNVPARPIFVPPDEQAKRELRKVLALAIEESAKGEK